MDDLKSSPEEILQPKKGGEGEVIVELLRKRGGRPITFEDWKKIEKEEERRGALLGKPREKITSIEEMLRIVESNQQQ